MILKKRNSNSAKKRFFLNRFFALKKFDGLSCFCMILRVMCALFSFGRIFFLFFCAISFVCQKFINNFKVLYLKNRGIIFLKKMLYKCFFLVYDKVINSQLNALKRDKQKKYHFI